MPTLAECEKAIGEPASAWVARCYEISCAIVKAGLVDGEAVYGHWVGPIARGSHFYDRRNMPFVAHGWVLLTDGRVLDPTRWVFENAPPYLYVGETPDAWDVVPCVHCDLLQEEHGEDGPDDQCVGYERAKWPYDEGGNQWRAITLSDRPVPKAVGRRVKTGLTGLTAAWVSSLLAQPNVTKLAQNQLAYLANLPYTMIKNATGPDGVKMIYEAIRGASAYSIAYIPADNLNRARRECGFVQ